VLNLLGGNPECDTGYAENGNPESYSEYGLWNRWPRWGDYSRVALRGVSRKLTIRDGVSISHDPYLPCHLDLIDTTSCSNRCMLTLYCLIGHSIIISRRWEPQALATSKPRRQRTAFGTKTYNCSAKEIKVLHLYDACECLLLSRPTHVEGLMFCYCASIVTQTLIILDGRYAPCQMLKISMAESWCLRDKITQKFTTRWVSSLSW